jgi:hypothetical protein
MVSDVEMKLSRSIRTLVDGLAIGDPVRATPLLREVFEQLEFYLPDVLRQIHAEWRGESLDGIIPDFARKVGDGTLEFGGLCRLISDQSVTPIHVFAQVAEGADEICWLQCRLGETRRGGMARLPEDSLGKALGKLEALRANPDAIDWTFKVEFGTRR